MEYRTMAPLYERERLRHPEHPHVIQLNMSATLAEQKGVNISKTWVYRYHLLEKMGDSLGKQEDVYQ